MDTTPRFNDPDNTLLKKICLLLHGGVSSGVLTFNTRSGAITLTGADVTGALGYTPVNPSGATLTGSLVLPTGIHLFLGPANATHPALKDSGVGIAEVSLRKGDDSGYANLLVGFVQARIEDTGTGTSPAAFEVYHNTTSGTPAINCGVSYDMRADSSTTDRQLQCRFSTLWTDATHATRTSHLRFLPTLNGVTTEALRLSNAQVDARNGAVFAVAGTQVVTSRKTGWTAATGTSSRATFATTTVTTEELAQRLKALLEDLTSHGLIGT
jgi:hypothetical protein